MGIGSARGDERAVAAAELAISSPLLEASIDGAHGVLLSIAGGSDLGLFEIHESAQLVTDAAHPEANIIFGAVIDDTLGDEVRVTVIAAGFDGGLPPARKSAVSTTVTKRVVDDTPLAAETAQSQSAGGTGPAAIPVTPEPPEPRREPRRIVFDDGDDGDELDVPDFLKQPGAHRRARPGCAHRVRGPRRRHEPAAVRPRQPRRPCR